MNLENLKQLIIACRRSDSSKWYVNIYVIDPMEKHIMTCAWPNGVMQSLIERAYIGDR